ncbi:MAG: hypothetical protein IKC09_10135 [Oscillospiraceae bacterium]|nr:hypothetical protein [Oscillospiraceae bacterium]
MRLLTEVWEQYSVAQNQAKRNVRRCARTSMETALPMLDAVVDRVKAAGEENLGVLNIPVKQIVGIASDIDKENYTADFLPLPSIKSEFAKKWTQLYMEYLTDRGMVDPIQCYEYLGKFYVIDGKKRVSVLKTNGAMMVKAEVTRILPVMTEDPQIQSYYEFVRTFEKTGLYQIKFTQPGNTDEFLKAIGYTPDHVWNESDRYSFIFNWYPFERALEVAFDGLLNITTADAVQILLKNHSYAELRNMPSCMLAELLQDAWLDMYRISNSDVKIRMNFTQKAS